MLVQMQNPAGPGVRAPEAGKGPKQLELLTGVETQQESHTLQGVGPCLEVFEDPAKVFGPTLQTKGVIADRMLSCVVF